MYSRLGSKPQYSTSAGKHLRISAVPHPRSRIRQHGQGRMSSRTIHRRVRPAPISSWKVSYTSGLDKTERKPDVLCAIYRLGEGTVLQVLGLDLRYTTPPKDP